MRVNFATCAAADSPLRLCSNAASCADAFRRSNFVGPLLLAGIVGAHWSVEALRALGSFLIHV